MPPKFIIDLSEIDLNNVVGDHEEIRKYNQQRYEMEHLDAIVLCDMERKWVAGYKDVKQDEFWVRGHIPGDPLLPGVIMCEAGAQLLSYFYGKYSQSGRFMVFGGMDGVKFRNRVAPGQRLVLLGTKVAINRRRWSFNVQGVVEGKMAFEGLFHGIPI